MLGKYRAIFLAMKQKQRRVAIVFVQRAAKCLLSREARRECADAGELVRRAVPRVDRLYTAYRCVFRKTKTKVRVKLYSTKIKFR